MAIKTARFFYRCCLCNTHKKQVNPFDYTLQVHLFKITHLGFGATALIHSKVISKIFI